MVPSRCLRSKPIIPSTGNVTEEVIAKYIAEQEVEERAGSRAMGWLGEMSIQWGNDPHSARARKDLIEEELFAANHDLFSEVQVVFFDTTSLYFEGEDLVGSGGRAAEEPLRYRLDVRGGRPRDD